MISTQDLAGELSDLGQAIGLISNGSIDSSWFQDPQQKLSTILSNAEQRQALIDLVNALLPPATIPGIPDGETWHPLLGNQTLGNVYLTINSSGPSVIFGIAADFGNPGSAGITANVQLSLPLVSADGSVQPIAGSSAGPLRVAVRAQLGLKKPPIQLDGISIVASIAPPSETLTVTLQNLDLGDGNPQNVVLDPTQLKSEAFHVILGLLKQELASLSGAVATHLLGVLGLADDGISQFPFLTLATDPSALQSWFQSLVQGGKIPAWLAHVAGLIGATDLTVNTASQPAGPWTVTLISFDTQSSLDLTLAASGSGLQLGLQATLFPGGASGPGRIEAGAVIASIPLAGAGNATVLPSASLELVAPGSNSAQLVSSGTFSVDSFRTGLAWTGSALQPSVVLTNVVFNGTTYNRLDLTNADSVTSAASSAVQTAVTNALGASAGSHLLALSGLSAPAGDPSSTHRVDLTALVANPARAIAEFHREVLLDGQRWSFLLGEVAGLINLPTTTSGTGKATDPWLVPIASSGPLTLNLAAWNAQSSGVATDPQKLRLGLRAVVVSASLTVSFTSELLAFDLPQSSAGTASLVAAQHAALLIQPGVAAPAVAGFGLTADSFSAEADWLLGLPFSRQANINNLSITSGGTTIGPLSLTFPVSGFDASNPQATATALGISVANLELLLRMLITRAALEWGGVPAYTIAALLGVHSGLTGLQSDWPVLTDPSGPGSLLSNPISALSAWLQQVTTAVSSDGTPFFLRLLNWLQTLVSNSLPGSLSSIAPQTAVAAPHVATTAPLLQFSGTGTYDDPWSLPLLNGSETVDALAWFEPAGPPAGWASALSSLASSAADFPALLSVINALAPFLPGLPDATKELDLDQAATGLKNLAAFLSSGDGVVPLSAQIPTGGTWTAGTNIQSAHPLETQDPAAISQIAAQVDNMAGGAASPRAVLLLGPAFNDHTTWQTFLGGKQSANFNFRVPNANPAAIDLSTVTAQLDYYTCDLNDDGTGDLASLTAQIGFAVARIGQLRPGVMVTLVAHSTAGVAARVFTKANPRAIQGLITLGTPHLGSALPFLTDSLMAGAVRLLQPLAGGFAAGPMLDAFNHYFSALDGYLPAAAPGALPTPAPYPTGSFSGTPSTDTAGRPAFAIGSSLAGTLQQNLAAAVAALATKAGTAGGTAPTHLSLGIRARLGLPSSVNSAIAADASLRAGLFRIALQSGAAEPTRPAQFLSVDAELSRPGDWLAGEPGFGAGRVRSIEFGVDMQANGSGGLTTTPRIVLHQASLNGPMLPRIDFANSPAVAQALLGMVVKAISTPPPPAASAISSLLAALNALDIVVTNPDGSMGISADAFAAITVDPASFFEPRVAAALGASGLAGFTGGTTGPWSFAIPGLPLTAYIQQGSWTIGLKTAPALPLGQNAFVTFDASVILPAFTPSFTASLTVGGLVLTYSANQLVVQAPPWLSPTTLVPLPTPAVLLSLLNDLLPRIMLSSATTALIQAAIPAGSPGNTILTDLFGSNFAQTPPDTLFSNTTQFLSSALGVNSGTGLDPAKLSKLLQDLNQAGGFPAGPGLTLPGGFQVAASGSGTATDPAQLQLATTAPVGGVLGAQLSLSFDQTLHVTPGGTLSLTTPLSGTWTSATITFGLASGQLSVSVTPQGQTPIQILPSFSGLGALASGLESLLPAALDQLVTALSTPGPAPAWLTAGLNMAEAVGVYDAAGGFAAHAATLKTLLQTDWLNLFNASGRGTVVTAAANMVNALGVSPAVVASGSALTWSFPLTGSDAGTVSLSAGWDGSGPLATISANGVKLGGGALTINLSTGYATGAVQCTAGFGLNLPAELAINASPQFNFGVSSSGGTLQFTSQFFPLAGNGGNGPLEIDLAPQLKITSGAQTPLQVLENWLLPLAANVAIKAANAQLNNPLWSGSSATLSTVLTSAGILKNGALKMPLPDIASMVSGAIVGLAGTTGISVAISSTLNLGIVNDSGKIGLRLSGQQPFNIGSYALTALFGAPSSWASLSPGADGGLELYLFTNSGGTAFTFTPELRCAGVGLGLAGADDAPLVNLSQFRLGRFNGYLFFDAQFSGGPPLNSFGGGLELLQLGIPLGLATGASGNPVATSLLQSGGTPGDSNPVNPGVDVSAWYWSAPLGDAQFHIQFGGQTGIFWIGVHSGFGPIYIDQLGLNVDTSQVELLIDGSVKVNGLTAQADELTVGIPYKSLTDPGNWTLDLRGLALGFTAPGITIAGGLFKNPGPPIEYDGLLLIQITQFGFIAVGAYSTPTDPSTNDTYTSLFVFAGVFLVIGLPPIIDITGLGLGVGYNRELIPPTDINQLPSFLLVEALDNTAAIANDPMGALMNIRSQIPAKRGSLWFAAGLHGNSFVVVNVTAVLYVALDRGVTIGILGVARMALPSDDTALVSLELGLECVFNPTAGTLLIIAQLTDNSWLLNKDCQLTGGFGYYMSFPDSQFVITIGGYHPAFQKPPAFPDVPRLGYHWSFLGVVNIKGESYFALTNSCVMAGARMEATYGPDWINVWFTAYTDFLLSWDPFFYNISAGVSLGATFRIHVCFFACVDIDISVWIGATLQVQGPPLNGTVSVDLAVGSVTVSFGPDPNPNKNFLDWPTFTTKYLLKGDPSQTAVDTHLLTGLLPPSPSGAQPTPGTASQPWTLTSEFSFQTQTSMPATAFQDFFNNNSGPLPVQNIDVAPIGNHAITSFHKLTLEGQNGAGWTVITGSGRGQFSADPSQFTFSPVIGQVSQATYQYIDHDNIPAAAQTLPALLGVVITGISVLQNPSSPIPISTLVDAGNSRPLPFATLTTVVIGNLQTFGVAADSMATITAGVTTASDLNASVSLLQGSGLFSQARVAAGLPPAGLQPMSARALQSFSSSGPLITPITTGLTMKPVGLALPPKINQVVPLTPVPLQAFRLRAVFQSRPLPAADAPSGLRTTVNFLAVNAPAAAGGPAIGRFTPPVPPPLPGARLTYLREAAAPRPTSLARSGRTLRSSEIGWSAGSAHVQAFQNAEGQISSNGVTIPAGTIHIWEFPSSANTVTISGASAVRVTFLSQSGQILADFEESGNQQSSFVSPPGSRAVAVTCLGNTTVAVNGGLGAVSLLAASQNRRPVVGWQTGNLMPQINSSTFLARGSCVVLSQPNLARKGKQSSAQGMLRLSQAVLNQTGIETWLPTSISVVGLILDQQDPTAASDGDLAIAVNGATLATPPTRVVGGARKILLYELTQVTASNQIIVGVASRNASRLSGIIGLSGRAQEWAVRWNGAVPEHIVPDGPLTPDGSVLVTITAVATAPTAEAAA